MRLNATDPENVPDLVLTLPVTRWRGPCEPALSDAAVRALESGKVLYFPRLGFELAPEEAEHLFRDWSDRGSKNISYEPALGLLKGVAEPGMDTAGLQRVMARFAEASATLLEALLPTYRDHLVPARTSFRPAEVAGRAKSDRKDDRRLHIDAFPSRPTGGERILRLFSNINPEGAPRVWRLGEPFETLAETMAPRVPRAFPGAAWLLSGLGITKGRRSPYDHAMLQLHDLAKADEDYQRSAFVAELEFPAGATWITFTDQVLHAATAGRYLLEQTFHLPVHAQVSPETAPLKVLERQLGRTLAP